MSYFPPTHVPLLTHKGVDSNPDLRPSAWDTWNPAPLTKAELVEARKAMRRTLNFRWPRPKELRF